MTCTITDGGGGACNCLVGQYTLVYDPTLQFLPGVGTWKFIGPANPCPPNVDGFRIYLYCATGDPSVGCLGFSLNVGCSADPNVFIGVTSCSCSPFFLEWDGYTKPGWICCAGSIKVIITP